MIVFAARAVSTSSTGTLHIIISYLLITESRCLSSCVICRLGQSQKQIKLIAREAVVMTHHSSSVMAQCTVNFIVSLILLSSLGVAIPSCFLLPDVAVEAMTNPIPSSQRGRNCREHKLLIIGLGRTGLEVANLAEAQETLRVFGTVRQSSLREGTIEDDTKIVRIPFDPVAVREHLFGGKDDQAIDGSSVVAASHVLFTIPLSREVDPVMKAVLKEVKVWWNIEEEDWNDGENKKNSDHRDPFKVLGILSTTGVYGNHDGKVVTETSPLLCQETSNAALYRKFEDDWISSSVADVANEGDAIDGNCDKNRRSRRLCIFRCAGIYDNSRSALHTLYKKMKSATPTDPPRTSSSSLPTTGNKTNRIHSMDLARGVVAGIFQEANCNDDKPKKTDVRIYNLADNLPESRSVVLSYAQELLASIGIDKRMFMAKNEKTETTKTRVNQVATNDNTSLSRSSVTRQRRRERESKLVCNKRMREELLPDDGLLYPTYREGLRAIFNDPITPWQQQQL